MEDWLQIVYIAVIAILAIVCIVSFIITKIKKNKAAQDGTVTESESADIAKAEYVSEKSLEFLKKLTGYMGDVEGLYDTLKKVTGADYSSNKKNDVIQKMQNYCLTNGIEFDENKISEMLETVVDASKNINKRV